jgi:hypothetical protein
MTGSTDVLKPADIIFKRHDDDDDDDDDDETVIFPISLYCR